MKTTRYFEEQILRKRPYLKRSWCEKAIEEPDYYDVQSEDERMRFWIFVLELGCYLRVVMLADGETVHNAFADPGFRLP